MPPALDSSSNEIPRRATRLRTALQLIAAPLFLGAGLFAIVRLIGWWQSRWSVTRWSLHDFTIPPTASLTDRLVPLLGFAAACGLAVVASWCVYRGANRGTRPLLPLFAADLWRAMLWAMLFLPVALFAAPRLGGPVAAALLIAWPTVLGRERRSRRFRRQWRPECPECGYSLRGAVASRCPECGQAYLRAQRGFRRWAVRRLAWDRQPRTGGLGAYIASLTRICLTPWQAGRAAGLPDRYGRAARWALAHVMIAAALGVAPDWVGNALHVRNLPPAEFRGTQLHLGATPARALSWSIQTYLAWIAVLGAPVLIGLAVATLAPGRHPAAKRGLAKWTLYSAGLLLPLMLAAQAWALWQALPMLGRFGVREWLLWSMDDVLNPRVLTVIFAAIWALGAVRHPYVRRGGWRIWLVHVFSLLAVWGMLGAVSFAFQLRSLL